MKQRLLAHFNLAFYLALATLLALLVLLGIASPEPGSWREGVYLASSYGYYGLVVLIVALGLLPLSLFALGRGLVILVAWLWLIYLAVDIATFNLYRFHIDWLLLQLFFVDFRGMGIPLFVLGLASLLAVALLLLVIGLARRASRLPARRGRRSLALLLLAVPVFLVNSVIHVWAARYDREEITRYNPIFPLYYPVTNYRNGHRISALMPDLFPPVQGEPVVGDIKGGGVVRYPLADPACGVEERPPSVLMIVLESWQSDTLNPEVMPKLWRFAGSATRFDQHVSSGSSTVPGLFGLMFGLHPSYFGIFKTSPNSNPSVFTEALVAQGYRSRVFTSSALERFALRTMLFSRVDEADYYSVNSDQRVLDHYLETLADPARGPEPGFDFVFFTSSHSSYNYPPEYARFRPLPAVEGGYALNKMADAGPYLNDYYNSLHYIDALLGQLFEALERSGRLEDTWVIVTGDHAEEFNQNGLGYWGHGSNFTRWQIQTPLVLRVPGQREGRVETGLSLHQDVVPTLMKRVLGCDADFADYANGADLFDLPARRGTVLSSYFANAYLVDGGVFELSTGREYAWDDMRQSRRLDDPAIIRELMEQRSRFLDRK